MILFCSFSSQVQIYSGTKAGATKFVTSGVDGRVVIWDVKVNLSNSKFWKGLLSMVVFMFTFLRKNLKRVPHGDNLAFQQSKMM